MPEASHPDGHPGRHRQPRRGSQLGRKSEIALLLIAEAGGHQVHLRDIPARERHYLNSKAGVLEGIALIVSQYADEDAPTADGRPTYSLTDLGRTTVDLIRSAAGT
jgi:hypothetical protein